MSYSTHHDIPFSKVMRLFGQVLSGEKSYIYLAIIYGISISFLSLATPISVQMLINTVANTGLAIPLIVLSATLFGLLALSGLLNALRVHLMELFARRFYARMVSEITVKTIYSQNPFFADEKKSALFNRYFDIIVVTKNIPILLIGAFTLILQAGVGFALVSFYHPFLLAFTVVFLFLLWLVWIIWGKSAANAAMRLSRSKHNGAQWIEDLGNSNGFFKSERNIRHALARSNAATEEYLREHKSYFRKHFAQTLSLLFIYAIASAALLGLGGWLVIQGELTLGQLVAAELILTAAFFGISQLGSYLIYFYDLCASIEELSLFDEVTQEQAPNDLHHERENSDLIVKNVEGTARGRKVRFNFEIKGASTVMAMTVNNSVSHLLTDLMQRHVEPKGGYIAFGGADIRDTESHILRQEIVVIDRPTIFETTMREYLHLSSQGTDGVLDAIHATGLEPVLAELENGLDTHLSPTGWPMSTTEVMQLKLAGAILAKPQILVLGPLYDLVDELFIKKAIRLIRAGNPNASIIYFTNRHHDLSFDYYLYVGHEKQTVVNNYRRFFEIKQENAHTLKAFNEEISDAV